MSESKTNVSVFGWGSFMPALALILITLKLTNTIDWSWWWVLAPVWVPFTIAIVIIAGFLVFALGSVIVADLVAKQQMKIRKRVFREKVTELKDKENQA
jgi:hypothetical protein